MGMFSEILDGSLPRLCGASDRFELRHIEVASGALHNVAGYLQSRNCATVLLIGDDRTWPAAGEALLNSLKDKGLQCARHHLPDEPTGSSPCANDEAVGQAQHAAQDTRADAVIGIGCGPDPVYFRTHCTVHERLHQCHCRCTL